MTSADIWPVVKLRLGLEDDDQKPLAESYIDEIEQRILNYCGISEVPTGLKFVWASMAIDAMRIEQPQMDGIENTSGAGESVKIGDTAVAPARSDGMSNTSKSIIDRVVLDYQVDLNRYRKLRW